MSGRALACHLLLIATTIVATAAVAASVDDDQRTARPLTTYERFLPLAVAGDPEIQHLLGYMFFYGEGVELDYEAAHQWFHLAAEEGHVRAQRNLGIIHARAVTRIPEKFHNPREANLWFSLAAANPENLLPSPLAGLSYEKFLAAGSGEAKSRQYRGQSGEIIYLGACAGCHGFAGEAAYPETPSFARGERLGQSDTTLARSIINGRGMMPAWGGSLSERQVGEVLAYIRQTFTAGAVTRTASEHPVAAPVDEQLLLGERTYLAFCGGCHGFNGIAWYVNSPSFALRERLNKSDTELAHSINQGRGAMPAWEYMLKPRQVTALIRFIRTLAADYESGIISELRRPAEYLRFRPQGETGSNWSGDDYR